MSKLSELGENKRASGEAVRGGGKELSFLSPVPVFASPLVCLSRIYFSRYPPNGKFACRLFIVRPLDTNNRKETCLNW